LSYIIQAVQTREVLRNKWTCFIMSTSLHQGSAQSVAELALNAPEPTDQTAIEELQREGALPIVMRWLQEERARI
jgi:hypothetical protein